MTDGLYFALFVTGFVCAICTEAWIHDSRHLRLFASSIRTLLYLGAIGALTVVALVTFRHRGSALVSYAALASIVAVLFADGVFLASAALRFASRDRDGLFRMLLLPPILWAARCIAAATFLMVGSSKLTTYAEFPFFQASGYSESFYIFICIFECICALGLILRFTVIPAIIALCVEMLGAIYTHFHNYFAKGLPDPFGNSLEAVRMLILLGFIAFGLLQEEGSGWRNRIFLQFRPDQPNEFQTNESGVSE